MPHVQGIRERVYDGADARPVGDPARRLDDSAAGRGGARAGVPQAGTTGVRAGGSHRGWWRSVTPRPSQICGELLAALDASEGRRRRRKRDTTPDAIGLTIKRDLLERAVAADPEPDAFEAWLHEQCLAAGRSEGGVRAMALSIFEEWRLAHDADAFRDWLARGAPSDDALSDEGSTTGR